MKYLSVLILIFALSTTWIVSKRASDSFVQHMALKTQLQEALSQLALRKNPKAIGIEFNKLVTEILGSNQQKATFSYKLVEKLDDGSLVSQEFSGSLKLKRSDDSDGKSRWDVPDSEFQIKQGEMVFSGEIISITSEPNSSQL